MRLLVALILLVLPAQSVAASKYVVTLIDLEAEGAPEGVDTVAQVIEALQVHPQVDYRELHRLLDAGANDVHYGNVASARQAFADGRVAFDRGEADAALQSFSNARFLLDASFGFAPTSGLLVDTMLYLGASQMAMLDRPQTEDQIAERDVEVTLTGLLLRHPDLVYAKDYFEPPFNSKVEQVRDRVSKMPRGDLRVTTERDRPARVYVNGVYRGVTPLTVPGLVAGRHLVRTLAQGFAVTQARTEVLPHTRNGITLRLVEARKGQMLSRLIPDLRDEVERGAPTSRTLGALKGLLFTDYAILAHADPRPEGTVVRASLYSLTSGSRVRSAEVVFGPEGPRRPAARLVDQLLTEDALPAPVAAASSGGGILTRWWFWAGAGAVVAGTVAAVLLTQEEEAQPLGLPKNGSGALLIRF